MSVNLGRRGVVLALAVAIAVLSSGAAPVRIDHRGDDELRAAYAEQVRLASRLLESIDADPGRYERRDHVEAIQRLRDCRLRLADSRRERIEIHQRCVDRLGEIAARTKLLADAGRLPPAEHATVEFEVNEARIALMMATVSEASSP